MRLLKVLGLLAAAYLILRAIAEPFVIDMNDPASYRNDWGGPSLAGVLAVHCLPGVIAAAAVAWAIVRRRRKRLRTPG
jgi:hypothetical protein